MHLYLSVDMHANIRPHIDLLLNSANTRTHTNRASQSRTRHCTPVTTQPFSASAVINYYFNKNFCAEVTLCWFRRNAHARTFYIHYFQNRSSIARHCYTHLHPNATLKWGKKREKSDAFNKQHQDKNFYITLLRKTNMQTKHTGVDATLWCL